MLDALLQDAVVKASTAFIVLPIILLVVLLATVYGLHVLLRPSREVSSAESRKEARFEAGNPEKGEAKARVSMQYLGYLIIFLAVEPALILLALALAAPKELIGRLGLLYAAIVLVYTPFIVYAVKEASRIEKWILE